MSFSKSVMIALCLPSLPLGTSAWRTDSNFMGSFVGSTVGLPYCCMRRHDATRTDANVTLN